MLSALSVKVPRLLIVNPELPEILLFTVSEPEFVWMTPAVVPIANVGTDSVPVPSDASRPLPRVNVDPAAPLTVAPAPPTINRELIVVVAIPSTELETNTLSVAALVLVELSEK